MFLIAFKVKKIIIITLFNYSRLGPRTRAEVRRISDIPKVSVRLRPNRKFRYGLEDNQMIADLSKYTYFITGYRAKYQLLTIWYFRGIKKWNSEEMKNWLCITNYFFDEASSSWKICFIKKVISNEKSIFHCFTFLLYLKYHMVASWYLAR